MKKKQNSQPPEIVRESNEEILEAMKQAALANKVDPRITEIVLELLTFTPEEDAVDKTIAKIVALSYEDYYTRKFGF